MTSIETRMIETPVHGRFLLRRGSEESVLVGFHGYAENAEAHLEQLLAIPDLDGWTIAAVQALHPFYNRSREVVASWMTRLDREKAIADNLRYTGRVLEAIGDHKRRVFLGFSQGVAMAYRAASHHGAAGVIALGGNVPPEIWDSASALPPVLLARGRTDAGYSATELKEDLKYLRSATSVELLEFDGGHEWTDEFRRAASRFLRDRASAE